MKAHGRLIVIGASWGGLDAVGTVLAALPAAFGAPVLVVQHRAEGAEERLRGLLDGRGPLAVVDVDDKTPLETGRVYLAPPGYHVLVEEDHLALSTEGRVGYNRPSIDLAFETAADAFGPAVVAVVLTGANDDGAAGLEAVRARGGIAIVQDPAGAAHPAMPTAALRARPQAVLALEAIGPMLAELAS